MGLFNSLNNLPKTQNQEVAIPKFTNIDLNLKQVNDRLTTSVDLSKEDMVTMIKNSYHVILNDVFLKGYENRENITKLFTNIDFVNAFEEVARQYNFENSERICCNKLAWDYMTSDDNNPYVKEALFKLSDTVNRTEVNILTTAVPISLARYLSLARFSSFDETKNIIRANKVLIKASRDLTAQNMIDIYSILFKKNFTQVFKTVMFDDLISICKDENEKETYSLISNVVLDILENMSISDILDILTSYTEEKNLMVKDVRFGIRTISVSDYRRIYTAVDCLERQREIFVP